MSAMDMVVLANTASIQVVGVMLVVSIITELTLTNTILVTLVKLVTDYFKRQTVNFTAHQ
jgi:hypothetical protein